MLSNPGRESLSIPGTLRATQPLLRLGPASTRGVSFLNPSINPMMLSPMALYYCSQDKAHFLGGHDKAVCVLAPLTHSALLPQGVIGS